MFSVIIPLYNKAKYIEKAIESIINQSYKEFELIIINDGSTDNSLEVLQNLDLLNVDCKIINQENKGVSITRNNGVKQAKYEYIAFLDADDWWEYNFLEEMKALIHKFPEGGIYASNYFIVKNGKNKFANIGVESDFNNGIINYCKVYNKTLAMPLSSSSVVIPKHVYELENGFKIGIKLGEDFDLWIRIALKYPVVFLNKHLAYYNQDVELENRAVGKLHNPENHMLWNLDYLSKYEIENKDYKQLIDKLRVSSLVPYYLNDKYRSFAIQELNKVDWSKQSKSIYDKYHKPIYLLKMKVGFMKFGSKIKQFILKNL